MSKKRKELAGVDAPSMTEDFLRSVGGRPLRLGKGGSEVWNFGWMPPENRTQGQEASAAAALATMPRFAIGDGTGGNTGDEKQALLFALWKHPRVVEANGFEFTGIKQLTGSCVGAGGGTCMMTLGCVDAITRLDPEEPFIPFWLLPYGRSRYYLGDRSPGEGSSGTTFARAAREDGVIPAKSAGLPKWTDNDGMACWGSREEMKWSDGDNPDTMALLPRTRQHLVKTTAQCRSADDVREAIRNGYPCTTASMYAHDGGRVQGSPACLLATRRGSWSHQESILGWWEHPQFGELFWLMNQWGQSAHGTCPTGAPRGGVWVKKSDVDWMCRDEMFAFSQFAGFPSQRIPWTF